jgi:hypothetical protein
MQSAMSFIIGLIFTCAFSLIGKFIVKNPEKVARVFAFGQHPRKFSVTYFRYCGWVFFAFFGMGAIFYMLLIPLALLGFHFGE